MEEEVEKKAPLTRLRRRLSVETEDTGSPSATGTPNKKRNTKLAAKPLLGNIDENVSVNSPKQTRRLSVGLEVAEEKTMTPSRRSTRIRSNTSITAETSMVCDSPRAKRAARRTSQVGSDSETPITPIRQTRRTRKDSASSVENMTEGKQVKPITKETISEEPEIQDTEENKVSPVRKSPRIASKKSTVENSDLSESKLDISTNKAESPVKKTKLNNVSRQEDEKVSKLDLSSNKSLTLETPTKKTKSERKSVSNQENQNDNKLNVSNSRMSNSQNDSILNVSTSKLATSDKSHIKENGDNKNISTEENQNNSILNSSKRMSNSEKTPKKANPDVQNVLIQEDQNDSKLNRSRKMSYSDKSAKKANSDSKNVSIQENQNDSKLNVSSTRRRSNSEKSVKEINSNKTIEASPVTNDRKSVTPKNKKSSIVSEISELDSISPTKRRSRQETPDKAPNMNIVNTSLDSANKNKTQINLSEPSAENKENIGVFLKSPSKRKKDDINDSKNMSQNKSQTETVNIKTELDDRDTTDSVMNTSETIQFLQDNKPENMQCVIVVETENNCEESITVDSNPDDQCVPVVNHEPTFDNLDNAKSDSVAEQSLNNLPSIFNNSKDSSTVLSRNNDSCEPMDVDVTIPENTVTDKSILSQSYNKSLRKRNSESMSVSQSAQDCEKSATNKSTLILTNIKDDSSIENVSKSSRKNSLNNLSNMSNVSNYNDKNQSQNKETVDTPIKNKNLQIIGMQTSTPVVADKINDSKGSKNNVSLSKNNSSHKSSDGESSDDDSVDEKNSMIDNEAEESDAYESGDSRDESEKRYEEEHEIIDKGESITSSDDDLSTDTDYEKDSFVVSSAEEDNDLMSGTGDDLSMSDNELSMSKKSKDKYNKKKLKKQKKASREMFEARHNKMNESNEESDNEVKPKKKNNRQRLESSSLVCSDESLIKPSKKNKARLDSSHETSKTDKKGNKKRTSLKSDSLNEREITTTLDDSTINKEDPLKDAIKLEPMTPLKPLNISTLSFNPDVEQVECNGTMSNLKLNETCDPLQNGSEDSSSENEEIQQNYDSMLSNLNKQKMPMKSLNSSISSIKKQKTKMNPEIDALNLTQTKNKTKEKQAVSKNEFSDDDSSSESLDLKLLFSDTDSNTVDQVDGQNKVKKGDSNISLTKSDEKSKLLNTKGFDGSPKVSDSIKKKNKKHSITIDENIEVMNNSVMDSSKKKSKKTQSDINIPDNKEAESIPNTPATKNKKKLLSQELQVPENIEVETTATPASKKKKKKLSLSVTEDTNITEIKSPIHDILKSNKKEYLQQTDKPITKKERHVSETRNESLNILNDSIRSNKKKKKSLSESQAVEIELDDKGSKDANSSLPLDGKKKRKKTHSVSLPINETVTEIKNISIEKSKEIIVEKIESKDESKVVSKKRKRNSSIREDIPLSGDAMQTANNSLLAVNNKKKKIKFTSETEEKESTVKTEKVSLPQEPKLNTDTTIHKSKKRKNRDDEYSVPQNKAKVMKDNVLSNINISKLPSTILEQLGDNPKKNNSSQNKIKKEKIIATCDFAVEETVKRKNKPSNYLEESIYLNSESPEKRFKKKFVEKPKVLPFMPTASTSSRGFTTIFKVNTIKHETKFTAQVSNTANFKKDYINKKIKKMGTYETLKNQRRIKLSKF